MDYTGILRIRRVLVLLLVSFALNTFFPKPGFPVELVRSIDSVKGTPFSRPSDVSVDRRGIFYILDTALKAVFVIDPEGRFSRVVRLKGKLIKKPEGIAVKYPGVFLIADSGNKKIYEFDISGNNTQTWSLPNSERLVDIASFGNRIFALDGKKSTVYIIEEKGEISGRFGGIGDHPGEFKYPFRINIDNSGRLFISDVLNSRIQYLDLEGKNARVVKRFGLSRKRFIRPGGLASDGKGILYFSDMLSGMVFSYRLEDKVLDPLMYNDGMIRFKDPVSLAFKRGLLGIVDQLGKKFYIYQAE